MSLLNIDSLRDVTIQCTNNLTEAMSAIRAVILPGGDKLDIHSQISNEADSLADNETRTLGLIELLEKIISASEDDELLLFPRFQLDGLIGEAGAVSRKYAELKHSNDSILENGGYADPNPRAPQYSSANSSTTINLKHFAEEIGRAIDVALDRALRLASIVDAPSYQPFNRVVKRAQGSIAELDAIVSELKKNDAEASKALKRAITAKHQIESVLEIAVAAEATCTSLNNQSQTTLEAIQKLNAESTSTSQAAQALANTVNSYQETFNQFQIALDERNAKFVSGADEQEKLFKVFGAHEATVAKIIEESKDALQWGTASGLASSFQISASELDRPIRNSARGFYISIALTVIVGIIVFNAVPQLAPYIKLPDLTQPPISTLAASTSGGALSLSGETTSTAVLHNLTGLSIRLAFLFPTIYLATFFRAQFFQLSATRSLYIFKKTVASAIPGFKEQASPKDADEHVKAMTAAAFERLLFNPQEEVTRDLTVRITGGRLSRWLVSLIQQAFESARIPK